MDHGSGYRSYTEQYLDSTGMFREAVVGILAAVAKQERVRLSERTIAGLQRAKAQGRVGGRPRIEHDPRTMTKLAALRRNGASIRQIARELDLSPTTVARVVKEQAMPGPLTIQQLGGD
jgi:DNA invertase Pin-like site-specific DNA recombinase